MKIKVGEIFEYEDNKLQVVESTGINCEECYFYKCRGKNVDLSKFQIL